MESGHIYPIQQGDATQTFNTQWGADTNIQYTMVAHMPQTSNTQWWHIWRGDRHPIHQGDKDTQYTRGTHTPNTQGEGSHTPNTPGEGAHTPNTPGEGAHTSNT